MLKNPLSRENHPNNQGLKNTSSHLFPTAGENHPPLPNTRYASRFTRYAFSLVELMIVVLIIAIVAVLALPDPAVVAQQELLAAADDFEDQYNLMQMLAENAPPGVYYAVWIENASQTAYNDCSDDPYALASASGWSSAGTSAFTSPALAAQLNPLTALWTAGLLANDPPPPPCNQNPAFDPSYQENNNSNSNDNANGNSNSNSNGNDNGSMNDGAGGGNNNNGGGNNNNGGGSGGRGGRNGMGGRPGSGGTSGDGSNLGGLPSPSSPGGAIVTPGPGSQSGGVCCVEGRGYAVDSRNTCRDEYCGEWQGKFSNGAQLSECIQTDSPPQTRTLSADEIDRVKRRLRLLARRKGPQYIQQHPCLENPENCHLNQPQSNNHSTESEGDHEESFVAIPNSAVHFGYYITPGQEDAASLVSIDNPVSGNDPWSFELPPGISAKSDYDSSNPFIMKSDNESDGSALIITLCHPDSPYALKLTLNPQTGITSRSWEKNKNL